MLLLLRLALDTVTYDVENYISQSAQDSFLVSHFQNENSNIVSNMHETLERRSAVIKTFYF